ncbi:3-hydroxyacyl-CoA dehydrogenase [Brachymonas denitrificans]|uniref:3-hydroxyacyl-CoA dehydrogenase n=1 Tax=Brachymonas denitrificans TaxID=28220 RepID=UPI002AFF9140|nr:3-hydroxyacyl-CoA dehydrogenase [Brachymonas denitrificans]
MHTATSRPTLLGIVGAGLMGRGIAQIAVQGGIPVVMHDARPGGAREACKAIADTLNTLTGKGKITQEACDAAVARLHAASSLADLASCTVVVEAIVENLEAKRTLLSELEACVARDCILASNTSSLSVTALAAGLNHPGRVAGFHFFSPVPLMKVVEVIAGPLTQPEVADALVAMGQQMGHTAVRASDTPGFIVNHAGRGYLTEALRLLGESVAEPAVIDRILRDAAGFRMGPFELLDLTGLDVSQPVMESIYAQYYQEPRYRPSVIGRQRQQAGLLGRKTQQGFYSYDSGKKLEIPEEDFPTLKSRPPIWIETDELNTFPEVGTLLQALGIIPETGAAPSPDALCVVLPLGQDASTLCAEAGLDPMRTVALDPLFLAGRRTVMTTPVTSQAMRDAARVLFSADGTPVSVVRDSTGCVVQRVLASIVNIGCDMAQQGIATPTDIDKAVTLGLGYPHGPLAWGDALGAVTVLRILQRLFALTEDPRYRPSPWLRRRAQLGLSLLTPDH